MSRVKDRLTLKWIWFTFVLKWFHSFYFWQRIHFILNEKNKQNKMKWKIQERNMNWKTIWGEIVCMQIQGQWWFRQNLLAPNFANLSNLWIPSIITLIFFFYLSYWLYRLFIQYQFELFVCFQSNIFSHCIDILQLTIHANTKMNLYFTPNSLRKSK